MLRIALLCLTLFGCSRAVDTQRLRECKPLCRPYAVNYVSAKNECVCDLATLESQAGK